jgi:hypothetical protein
LLIALAFALGGCGVANETGVPGSSGAESVPAETLAPPIATLDESMLKPPPILLVSRAGKQEAIQSSFCVQYVDQASGQDQGVCADGVPVFPKEVSTLQTGDWANLVLAGAFVKDEGSVVVRPLGCKDEETLSFDLTAGMSETHWRVQLKPGAYQLDVFARFGSNDGRSGDVTGTVGLLVGGGPKENDYIGVVAVRDAMQVCPFPD